MSETTAKQETFVRFNVARRIEHLILILSFTTLALTGLPQKFATAGISDFLIGLFGGIESIRVIHRVAATVFLVEAIYHVVLAGYGLFVLRQSASMLPTLKDGRDAFQAFGYNIGIVKAKPKMPRYNYEEKMEYWAMVWGLLIMALTGFMLWNPIETTRFLPGVFIPAAKAAHGWEAVLAVAAIILWHFYNVHIRQWNSSMINGKLKREQMEEDHARELEDRETQAKPEIPAAVIRRRQSIYLPTAGVISLALLFLVFKFVTVEQTAIVTILPVDQNSGPAYQPQTPTPLPTERPTATANPEAQQPAAAAALTWDAGIGSLFKENCGMCHGSSGGLDLSTYADTMKGGTSGQVILAGNSDGSPLVQIQAAGGHPKEFTPDQLAQVKAWIDAGALEK